jgi:hypothetical protein
MRLAFVILTVCLNGYKWAIYGKRIHTCPVDGCAGNCCTTLDHAVTGSSKLTITGSTGSLSHAATVDFVNLAIFEEFN